MKKSLGLILVTFLLPLSFIRIVSAHCPLCTIGAGAVAAGAATLGVSKIVIGIFIGAFAISMGLWLSNKIKKQFIPFQKTFIVIGIFLLTVLPLLSIIGVNHPVYISIFGNYGSLFNRTYMLNLGFIGSIFGGLIVFFSPKISKKLTQIRKGKIFPFQGVIITLLSLIIVGGIIQVLT